MLIYQCFKSWKTKLKYVTLEVQIGPCVKVHGCNFISSIWLFAPWTHYHVSSSFQIVMCVNFIHEHNFIHAWYNSFVLKITLIFFHAHVITFNLDPMIITYMWSISSMNKSFMHVICFIVDDAHLKSFLIHVIKTFQQYLISSNS